MGLNIILQKVVDGRPGEWEPLWDTGKFHGDRDFAKEVALMPRIEVLDDCDLYVRPMVIEAWRELVASREWPNPGRFERLLDLIEQDPELHIFFSY